MAWPTRTARPTRLPGAADSGRRCAARTTQRRSGPGARRSSRRIGWSWRVHLSLDRTSSGRLQLSLAEKDLDQGVDLLADDLGRGRAERRRARVRVLPDEAGELRL